jgi:hypothetical protein
MKWKKGDGGSNAPSPFFRVINAEKTTYYKVHDAGNYTPDVRHK